MSEIERYYVLTDGTKAFGIFKAADGRYYYADESNEGRILNVSDGDFSDPAYLQKSIVWSFFVNHGYSEEAAAAIIGNIHVESGFKPDAVQAGSQEGIGLLQWSYGRKAALIEYAKSQDKSWTDLHIQLNYLLNEMENYNNQGWRFYKRSLPYPAPYNNYGLANGVSDFKQLQDINYATKIFQFNFTSPAYSVSGMNSRLAYANDAFRRFAKEIVVYVDPGHGGVDPGAYIQGIKEAPINLSISKMVRERLSALGYRVITSRETDKTVELLDRSIEANNKNAHIYISIHQNSMPGANYVRGTETYYYDGVSSNYTRINQEMHTNPVRLDLSKELATLVQKQLLSHMGSVDRGVRSANFSVIRESKMPAILIEGGYMSNPTELYNLKTTSYQSKIANGIVKAVQQYFYRV